MTIIALILHIQDNNQQTTPLLLLLCVFLDIINRESICVSYLSLTLTRLIYLPINIERKKEKEINPKPSFFVVVVLVFLG